MLAVAPLRNTTKEHEGFDGVDIHTTFGGGGGGGGGFTINPEEFPEFVDHGSLLESIDFDDLFNDGDVLPDLEIDPDILMDFSGSSSATNNNDEVGVTYGTEGDDKSGSGKGEAEVVSRRDESRAVSKTASKGGSKRDRGDKKRKYSSSGNGKNNKDENNQGKRKVKVDWTPELHRRFVQVVEQLGVDKAVPSRILELMGIDCLTRHNVASHLQKYRSHRKHLLAREAEAASWTHKRHMYGAAAAGGKNGCRGGGWMATTVGFPPPTPPQMMPHHPHYGPLHVWGHPSVDQSLMQNIWPKHLPNSRSPPPPPPLAAHPPIWVPPPPMDPYWHQRVPNRSTPGAPCFAQLLAAPTTRFGSPSVTGIPPPPHHSMYKSERTGGVVGVSPRKSGPLPPADFFPSKESIDAAIGDALTKPWLPLPLGLKPPAVDSVMVELHRHGVSMVPPPPAADDEPKKT